MPGKWKKQVQQGDALVKDPKPTDIVIPVMGPTGVGKSTFINSLLGVNRMKVGLDLESCTSNLESVVVHDIPNHPKLKGRRLIIVDTPGFDDTWKDDVEILRRIVVWLASAYDSNMKLGGVIYLHEITQTRMLGTSRKNFSMFQQLCGKKAHAVVILGTTKWAEVKPNIGEEREKQLRENYWKDMLSQGSNMARVQNTKESAWALLDPILTNVEKKAVKVALKIQVELVELQLLIPETKAGQELRYTLQQLLEMQKKGGEGANGEQRKAVLNQIKALNIPFSRRFATFFGLV